MSPRHPLYKEPAVPRMTVILLLVLVSLFSACSDDSTGPSEPEAQRFSRMMWSQGNTTTAADCVIASNGNRVVAGAFAGALHVEGSADSLVTTGGADIFLTAFRPDGSLAWKNHIGGGPGFVAPNAVTRDASDNLYLAGALYGTVSLGGTDFVGDGFNDVLVIRADATGDLTWAVAGIGPTADYATDIVMAHDGGLYVCGVASSEIIVAGEDLGEFDSNSAFLVKINASGGGNWSVTAT
jgi:hypothetical protein